MPKYLAFFPTPYPDELLYSVLCRFQLRGGSPTCRPLSEELFGRRSPLAPQVPPFIGELAAKIPKKTGMTADYFIAKTTAFPYFYPFLTNEKVNTFLDYMKSSCLDSKSQFFALGLGKARQPRETHLRFCPSCWKEDIEQYGEAYWRRGHQLPGVLVCHHHKAPLHRSAIMLVDASRDFYPASQQPAVGNACGHFSDSVMEKLVLLAEDSQWILDNGHELCSHTDTYRKYNLWLQAGGYQGLHGFTWHKQISEAVVGHYGQDVLQFLNAFDADQGTQWTRRIFHHADKLIYPMYHLLVIRLLAGSAASFFTGEEPRPLPYGEGPWPCRNPLCEYDGRDVIESIDIRYDRGHYRAAFECPHCGMLYRRKRPIPKEQQYTGTVYIAERGHLFEALLREYLIERELPQRLTCELLQTDLYTVRRHARRLGLLTADEAPLIAHKYEKNGRKLKYDLSGKTEDDIRALFRARWQQILAENPGASRSQLASHDAACYMWLLKNDWAWYEEHSPPARYAYMDWAARDAENLPIVQAAVEAMRSAEGRPKRISRTAVADYTGINGIRSQSQLAHMPLTSKYLGQNLETLDDWRKRKIQWAIRQLQQRGETIAYSKIAIVAALPIEVVRDLSGFIEGCLVTM